MTRLKGKTMDKLTLCRTRNVLQGTLESFLEQAEVKMLRAV